MADKLRNTVGKKERTLAAKSGGKSSAPGKKKQRELDYGPEPYEEDEQARQESTGGAPSQAGGTAPAVSTDISPERKQEPEPEKPKGGLGHLWDTIGLGGMNEEERNAAAARTQAAEAYQDEQNALLAASKERERQAAAGETGSTARAGDALPENKDTARQAEWSRNWNDERLAATRAAQEEAANRGEGLGTDEQRDEQKAMREAAQAAAEAPKTEETAKPASGFASFMDDEDDGEDEIPSEQQALLNAASGSGLSADDQRDEQRAMRGAANADPEREALAQAAADAQQKADALDAQDKTWWGPMDWDALNRAQAEAAQAQKALTDYDANAAFVNWEGRDALIAELNEIDQNSGNVTDPEQANAEAARRAEIIRELEAGDEAAGNGPQSYNDVDRARQIMSGSTGQYASGFVNAAGTALDWLGTIGAQYGNASPYAGYATDELSAATIGTGTEEEKQAHLAEMQAVQNTAAQIEQVADSLGENAAADLASAKAGLSGLGAAGVDIATNVIQLGYDAALGKIPGGSSLFSMFLRSAGGASQEARQAGASVGEQVAYGITKGGIEVATEKLFDGVAGIFGKGAADDVVEGAIRRLAETDTGRTVLRVLAGAGGEGAEEAISDLLTPFAEQIYNDESLRNLWENGYDGSEILYDFLIGAAIGGLGSGGSIATGQNAAKNAEARQADAVEARVNEQMNGVMDALGNPNAGQEQNAPLDPAQVLAEQATGAQPVEARQTSGEERAEGQAPAEVRQQADEVVDALLGPMADAQAKEDAAERVAEILTTPTEEAAETPQEAPEAPGDIPAPPTTAETSTGESQALNSGLANDGEGIGQRQTTRSASEAAQGLVEYTGTTSKAADVAADLQGIADYIQSNNNGQGIDQDTLHEMAENAAAKIVNNVQTESGGNAELFDSIKNYLKGKNIQISDELRGDSTDYDAWRKSLFGKLNLRNSGLPIDTLYQEMNDMFGDGLFPMDITAQHDEIERIVEVLDTLRPKTQSWADMASQEDYDAALAEITQKVLDEATGLESAAPAMDSENFASLEGETPPSTINGVETVPSGVQANGPTVERGFAENVRTAEGTEEALSKSLGKDRVTYERLLNKDVLAKAQSIYDGGYESAKGYLDGAIRAAKEGAKLPPEAVPLARMVANEMTRNGDVVGAERLIADVAAELTQAGQLGQVAKILRQSVTTPEGKLYGVQKTVEKLNEQAGGKYKVELPQELVNEYNAAETDEARDELISQMQKSIADQIPASWMDKYTALRYTAMLGNFKTQTRNVVGNLTSMVGRMVKDRIAAVMEYIGYIASGGEMERTKSVLYNPKLFSDAWADFTNVQDEALGEAKYSDSARQMDKEIQDKRRIFKSRVLEGWRLGTKWAMEQGDVIFSRSNYADAMAGWMAAHKVQSIADMSPEMLERARAYAIQQAQEATFRDNNDFSLTVSQLGRNKANTKTGKVISAIGEGIMPFRKTPANILVRAEEYSPLGLINTAVDAANAIRGKDGVTASDVIDQAAKTLTGTGIMALGYLLAASGNLRGKDKDKEQENFDKLRGAQDWSLKIGDRSYTMDWVAPYSIPLFMGAQMEQLATENGLSVGDVIDTLTAIGEPMLDMSMLDGINDAFEVVQSYTDDTPPIALLSMNALASLLSQSVPTLLGQVERYGEDYRQTTYTDPTSALPTSLQRKLSQTMAKIPGIGGLFEDPDFQQQDYIDAWGRKQETPQGIGKVWETFLSPYYSSEDRSTPIDDELQRLYQSGADGADKVYPDYASRNLGGDIGRLTPEEWETYATTKGQNSLALVQDFIESEEYQGMEDAERAEIIQNLYTLANNSAKTAVMQQRGEEPAKLDPVTALVEAGMEPGDAGGLVLAIGGDGKVRQDDIKTYYAGHKGDEAYLRALWDAMGYKTSWDKAMK